MTRPAYINRRTVVTGLLSAPAVALLPSAGRAQDSEPLKVHAARKGLVYGAAVQTAYLENRRFADAFSTECAMLVPEWQMKWGAIEKQRGERDYSGADKLVAFAEENGLGVRGHTAVWANNMPEWARSAIKGPDGQEILDKHTRAVIDHFKGRLAHWDVVNEAIEPGNGRPDGLRSSVLLGALGPGYIGHAFDVAANTDPAATRYYNDTGCWAATAEHEARRRATLGLLSELKADGVPVQGLGMQAHLEADTVPFDPKVFRAFLKEVADLGLEIMVTELDVNDRYVSGDLPIEQRDARVAEMTQRYLDTVLDEPAVTGVMTWGISDRHTWLNNDNRWARKDGRTNRCLPLDTALRRKPMWQAMADAFDAAPERRPAT